MTSALPTSTTPKNLALEMFGLATPIIVLNISYVLLGVVDTILAGRISTEALAGVAMGSMVFYTFGLLLRGTVSTIITFVAQAFGAEDFSSCGRWLMQFVWFALLLSCGLLLYFPLFGFVMPYISPDQNVQKIALTFAHIRLLELPFMLLLAVFNGFLLGIGNSKTPMYISWLVALLNVALNTFVVLGPWRGGVAGMAFGTATSVVLGCGVAGAIVVPLAHRRYGFRFHALDGTALRRMAKVGVPNGILEFIEVGAFTAFLAIVGRIGTGALAASQIGNQISSIAFMPGFGFAVATSSLVGRFIGAKDFKLANRSANMGALLCVAWMSIAGFVFWVFGDPLVRLFTQDPEVIRLGRALLTLMVFYQIFDAINIVYRAALVGAGDTRFPAVVTLVGAWGGMVLGAHLIVGYKPDMVLAWLAPFAYLTVMGLVYWWRWTSGQWKTMKI